MSDGKRKSHDADASGHEEDQRSAKKSKGMIEDLEGLKCPICLQLPEGDVYSCSNGHSVCNDCSEKLDNCPSCRVPYQRGTERIRNHFAEEILSKVLFECPWKAEGCEEDRFNRQELVRHETDCLFNPAPIKMCQLLFGKDCDYEVVPTFLRNPSLGLPGELLDHVRNVHYKGRRFGIESFPGDCVFLTNTRSSMDKMFNDGASLVLHRTINLVDNDQFRNTIGVFIIYGTVVNSGGDYKLSWFAARVTDKPVSRTVSFRVALKGTSTGSMDGCVSNIRTSWDARIMSVKQLYQYIKKPVEEREELFSVRWSDIQQFYLNTEGDLEVGFVFGGVKNDGAVGL